MRARDFVIVSAVASKLATVPVMIWLIAAIDVTVVALVELRVSRT